jgi:hypothetical protein
VKMPMPYVLKSCRNQGTEARMAARRTFGLSSARYPIASLGALSGSSGAASFLPGVGDHIEALHRYFHPKHGRCRIADGQPTTRGRNPLCIRDADS